MDSSAVSRSSLADRALVPGTALIGATFLIIAAWMVFDPRSFYDSIGDFGPYNSHYIGDAAAFQGGIGLALIASVWVASLRAGALLAATAMTLLHAINHWIDIDAANGNSNADVFDAISLTVQFALSVVLFRAALRQAA